MAPRPLVSCIMLTRDHRRFVSQAIWYFLRQEYSPCELIVVDDGDDAVGDLVPNDPRILYTRVLEPLSNGAKRNLGCRLANGEVIAHWDDDLWYSPSRLRMQVEQLQAPETDLCGFNSVLHYHPHTGNLWHYEPAVLSSSPQHAGTLAYRRTVWHGNRFSGEGQGEVSSFVGAVPPDRVHIGDGSGLAVAVLHGRSSGVVNAADRRWQRRPFDALCRLVGSDLPFYAGLRSNGYSSRSRLTPVPITLAATFMVYDGYGSMAEYLALGMARAGADLHLAPFRIDTAALSPEFQELLRRSRPDPKGIVLCHAWWGENLARFGSARELFVKTAWETSRLPADWPARLNHATAVIVPSEFTARVFRDSGVRVPVEVAHEGVDPSVYPYVERPTRPGLTTLVVGVLAARKNFRQAVEAWKLAFADDPEARLLLKARFQLEAYTPDDPRIRVVDTNERTRGIAHWYHQADVLLALGNEGFGLPLVEGMATGLPAVALNAEAQADICVEAEGMVLPVRRGAWEAVDGGQFGPCGARALPDVHDAARQLRWVADHREEAVEMGRRASAWAHMRRNVWDMGPATVAAIERHTRSSSPVRRTFAVWARGDAGPVPYRYYCQDFARWVSRALVYDAPPAAWRSRSLHIQHTPGLFDDDTVAREVDAAKQGGTSVVVTEHLVGETADAWELRADVLVALEATSAARLRARWPSKRVEVIPPGCPSWRRATRNDRGRTVAVLGLPPAPGAAAERLRTLAGRTGADLLVFAPGAPEQSGDEVQRFMPCRVRRLPPSADRLADRLNEEADLVVIAHGAGCDIASSRLAGVAVASGVPVVVMAPAAPDELADATVRSDDLESVVPELFGSDHLRAHLAAAAREFCAASGWQRVASLHHALWRTVSS